MRAEGCRGAMRLPLAEQVCAAEFGEAVYPCLKSWIRCAMRRTADYGIP
ncbi:hypothetical protein [Anaerotruncus colihominis]|nr:hypothetical protein [Anaerotruncus colihominis]